MDSKRISYLVLSIGLILVASMVGQQVLEKRTPFNIALVSLTVKACGESCRFKEVGISTSDGPKEFATIGYLDDKLVQYKRDDVRRTIFAEPDVVAHNLTEFECKWLKIVIRSLALTLEEFEQDLQRKRFDKCLYLDAHFPRFLKAFYYLSSAAFKSNDALPKITDISETLFDVSLRSQKSDYRIYCWQKNRDHIIKLRIATKELIYQLKLFETKKLDTFTERSEIFAYNDQLRTSYELFVRLYFNLYPDSGKSIP